MNTLLVDVCDTLYRENTTFDFMAWRNRDDPTESRLLESRRRFWHRRHYRLTGHDRIRTRIIGQLTVTESKILKEQGQQFLDSITRIEKT
ncbi:MAG: hypothetical protein CMQ05_12995 [Gammaproteobacteria bacterium]|nr:hypothetical protein [Gammaproteobacteria bacterium]RPG25273.1 MAG: hypothetical protein CBC10_009215 [Gammaproteobacteria bacterium TMED50]